jgi:hypothetical protein
MGHKRRILRNPKFAHLKKIRFSEKISTTPLSNLEAQEEVEEQPPIIEVHTPVLDAVQKEFEVASTPAGETKPKMTIKKSSPKKRATTRATAKKTTRKPASRKTTAKRKSTKAEIE